MTFDPTAPAARFTDLQRQGFMKPRREPRAKKAEAPFVTCEDCQNWHRQGKHTSPAAERKARRLEREIARRRPLAK